MSMKIAKIINCMLFISSYTLWASHRASEKPLKTLYVHGLHCKARRVHGLIAQNIIQKPADSFSFNDTRSCLGQSEDIETLKNETKNPEENYILYGRSRGGAAIISFLARYNPKNTQAIIIDAAPADMIDRVDEIQCAMGAYPFQSRSQKEWILRQLYPAYPQGSIPPVQNIPNIENKELPIFIVHSDNDDIVNIRAGLKNYKAFKEAGFPNVYFCGLQHGGHAYNAKGADSNIYRMALHSFYKKHGFDYDKEQAILDDITHLQPTIEDVDKQIKRQENKLEEKFKHRRAINIAIGIHTAFIMAAIMHKK